MFGVRYSARLNAPTSIFRQAERSHFDIRCSVLKKKNTEHRISNTEHRNSGILKAFGGNLKPNAPTSKFGVRCSVFDIPFSYSFFIFPFGDHNSEINFIFTTFVFLASPVIEYYLYLPYVGRPNAPNARIPIKSNNPPSKLRPPRH